MSKTKKLLTTVVLIIFAGGAVGLGIWNESRATPATERDPSNEANAPTERYDRSQIAQHSDSNSCWVVIENNVYDVTEYIEEHPGGARAILGVCGADATGSFNSMPTAVIPAARAMLAKYLIGTLAE